MKTLKTNYLGKKYLEQCSKITVKDILSKVALEIEKEILTVEFDWLNIIKTKANYWWYRIWFKCPICGSKVFTLYNLNEVLKCRKCTWLHYRKQRFKGMIEETLYKM